MFNVKNSLNISTNQISYLMDNLFPIHEWYFIIIHMKNNKCKFNVIVQINRNQMNYQLLIEKYYKI